MLAADVGRLAGGYLDFTGGVGDDGVMELRHEKLEDGVVVPFRMRFTEVKSESFVWLWERGAARERGASSGGSSTRACR